MPSPYSYSRQLRKKTTYRRGPYRSKYAGGIPRMPKSRAIIAQAGVGGAQSVMTAGMPLPPEVKYSDQPVLTPAATLGQWNYLQTSALSLIGQGAQSFQRIGRQIKLVGMVYRMNVVFAGGVPVPYTIDFICDKQPSSAAGDPPLANQTTPTLITNGIYASANHYSLPNVQGQDRFQFLRRVEVRDPNNANNTVSGFIKLNKLVTYDASTLSIADLVSNNILVTFGANNPAGQTVAGIVRYYYVDA